MSYLDKLTEATQRLEMQALALPYALGTRFTVEDVEYQILTREEFWNETLNIYTWQYQIKKLPDVTGKRWKTTNYRIKKSIHEKKGKIL